MEFVAVDVETANADMASICQVGFVHVRAGATFEEWQTLVDPRDYFDPVNISIHGISEADVLGAPTFPDVAEKIRSWLGRAVAVCHTHFDRVAFRQSFQRLDLPEPSATWLDSARVARRTWKECSRRGYGLRDVCSMLGYRFTHHEALQDARAAAHVLIEASRVSGLDVEAWLKRVRQPIDPRGSAGSGSVAREGNPEGDLYGEVLVFTGALKAPRREAADHAARVGCRVTSSVSRKTTMLIVGDQDLRALAGHQKSSKHRKAEQLIASGVPIRILKESDFVELVGVCGSD